MMEMTIEIDWLLLGLVAGLGLVLSALYAALLSTAWGREVCERRTHWTVIGGHLLMALTISFISPALAGLWLGWSVVHGLPLVIRSEVDRWRDDRERLEAFEAGLRGLLRGGNEEGGDCSGGNGYGGGGAGV